jgi:hypothetical protein
MKCVEWDKYTQNFGYVEVPQEIFKCILKAADDGKLNEIAHRLGSRFFLELIQFIFKRSDSKAFFDFMSLLSRYSGLAKYEIESNDRSHIMITHHHLGIKWSNFLKIMLDETIKTIFNVNAIFDVTQNQVSFKFTEHQVKE